MHQSSPDNVDVSEQRVLAISIGFTLVLALAGVIFGLWSGSQAIVFDGIFDTVDAGMSCLALFVTRLLLRTRSKRFQFGFWHFEPLVALLNGSVLLTLCVYALVNSVNGLISGGKSVELNAAALYALITGIASFALYAFERRVNRRLQSEFIRIDMNSFLMSGFTSLGLFVGFGVTKLLTYTQYAHWEPYADPLILLVIVVGLLPIPLAIVRRALQDVFLIAPRDASERVKEVMSTAMLTRGLLDFNMYVVKQGRVHMIDIHILVPIDYAASVRELDEIRADIGHQLVEFAHLDEWLSITFTTRRDWT